MFKNLIDKIKSWIGILKKEPIPSPLELITTKRGNILITRKGIPIAVMGSDGYYKRLKAKPP